MDVQNTAATNNPSIHTTYSEPASAHRHKYSNKAIKKPITQQVKLALKKKCARYGLEVASGLVLAYFAGPYVAVATRALFPYGYSIVFGGVPELYQPSYWTTYTPMKEHACGYAYNNGTAILSAASTAIITSIRAFPLVASASKKALLTAASTASSVLGFMWNKSGSSHPRAQNKDANNSNGQLSSPLARQR